MKIPQIKHSTAVMYLFIQGRNIIIKAKTTLYNSSEYRSDFEEVILSFLCIQAVF